MLWTATPESVLRASKQQDTGLDKLFRTDRYFGVHGHSDIFAALNYADLRPTGDGHGQLLLVSTFAPAKALKFTNTAAANRGRRLGPGLSLGAELDMEPEQKQDAAALYTASGIVLEQCLTLAEFEDAVAAFWKQEDGANVLVVQCDSRVSTHRHIQHCKYVLEKQRATAVQTANAAEGKNPLASKLIKHVVLVVHQTRPKSVRKQAQAAPGAQERADRNRGDKAAPKAAQQVPETSRQYPLVFESTWRQAFIDSLLPPPFEMSEDVKLRGGLFMQTPAAIMAQPSAADAILRRVYRRSLTRLAYPRLFDVSQQIAIVDDLLSKPVFDDFRGEVRRRVVSLLEKHGELNLADLLLQTIDRVQQTAADAKQADNKAVVVQQPLAEGSFVDASIRHLEQLVENCFASILGALDRNNGMALFVTSWSDREHEEDHQAGEAPDEPLIARPGCSCSPIRCCSLQWPPLKVTSSCNSTCARDTRSPHPSMRRSKLSEET